MLKKIKRYAIVLVAGCVLIWVGLWAAKKFAPPVYYKIAANVTGRDFVVPGTVDPVEIAHPFWRGANLEKIQKQLAAAGQFHRAQRSCVNGGTLRSGCLLSQQHTVRERSIEHLVVDHLAEEGARDRENILPAL